MKKSLHIYCSVTINSRYIAVEYNTILTTIPEEEIKICSNYQLTKDTSSLRVSYGVTFMKYFDKSDREISRV